MKRLFMLMLATSMVTASISAVERQFSPRFGEGMPSSRANTSYNELDVLVGGRKPRVLPEAQSERIIQMPQTSAVQIQPEESMFSNIFWPGRRNASVAPSVPAWKRKFEEQRTPAAKAARVTQRERRRIADEAKRLPLNEQLLAMPEEYVTPQMAEAYEQWRPSKVDSYFPKRSWGLQGWKDYFNSQDYDIDKYAAQRRVRELGNKFIHTPIMSRGDWVSNKVSGAYAKIPEVSMPSVSLPKVSMPKAPSRTEYERTYLPYEASEYGDEWVAPRRSAMVPVERPQTWGQYFKSFMPNMPRTPSMPSIPSAPNRVEQFEVYEPSDAYALQPGSFDITAPTTRKERREYPRNWREYLRLPKGQPVNVPRANENLEPITW